MRLIVVIDLLLYGLSTNRMMVLLALVAVVVEPISGTLSLQSRRQTVEYTAQMVVQVQ
jgi:hypothetical protein